MSLRFCTLNYLECEVNDIPSKSYAQILNDGDLQGIILTEQRKFKRFVTMSKTGRCDSSSDCVIANSMMFVNAHQILKGIYDEKFLPVVNVMGELLCFCYQDFEIEKLQEDLLELVTFNEITSFADYIAPADFVRIWGINEIAYYFHVFLSKQNIPHGVYGDLWEYIDSAPVNVDPPASVQSIDFLAEGNYGLPIRQGQYGKAVLEWHRSDYEVLYRYYQENCQFDNVLSIVDMRRKLYEHIVSGKPFCLARIGNTEFAIMKEYFERKAGVLAVYSDFWLEYLYRCCGFFANPAGEYVDEFTDRYAELTRDSMRQCDYQICWGDDDLASGLNFVLKDLETPDSLRVPWDAFSTPACLYHDKLLKNALAGKKVLVVSPFIQTVKQQYSKKAVLFEGEHVLPDFELLTYKAPETQMGKTYGYQNWFQVFEKIREDILKTDFDIAIIGAGAYGLPLAVEIKNSGRQAISISSFLANWFGIKMKRYVTCESVNRYWNSQWVFPSERPPEGYENIEGGCYWR